MRFYLRLCRVRYHCCVRFSVGGRAILFSFHSICYPRLSFSLSLLVVTQIRGHLAGSSPPPVRSVPYVFSREDFIRSIFLPSSTRVDARWKGALFFSVLYVLYVS